VTAQGHPRRIFQTAIERGNLLLAEATARELGRLTLDESLGLTALVAEQDPERRSRFAVRWLRRLLEEDDSLTIVEAPMAASCLSALGGPSHDEAFGMLAAMAERATRQGRARRRRAASTARFPLVADQAPPPRRSFLRVRL
jgi:hypothetical protein